MKHLDVYESFTPHAKKGKEITDDMLYQVVKGIMDKVEFYKKRNQEPIAEWIWYQLCAMTNFVDIQMDFTEEIGKYVDSAKKFRETTSETDFITRYNNCLGIVKADVPTKDEIINELLQDILDDYPLMYNIVGMEEDLLSGHTVSYGVWIDFHVVTDEEEREFKELKKIILAKREIFIEHGVDIWDMRIRNDSQDIRITHIFIRFIEGKSPHKNIRFN